MIKIKRKSIDKTLWTLYMFVLIFAPPFIPYPHLVLAVGSTFAIVMNHQNRAKSIIKTSGIYKWIVGMAVWAIYICTLPMFVSLLLNDIVNTSHYISLFNRFGVLIVTIIPCCTLILCVMKKRKYDYHFFLEAVINAGLLQGICSVAAFISPSVKNTFITLMRRFTGSGLYDNTWYINVRAYGFAWTLVDLFGLGISIIAGLSFFYGVTEKRRYIFYSIIIAVSTLLNARTGVILYIIAIVASLVYLVLTGRLKATFRTFLSICLVTAAAMGALQMISENTATAFWINEAIKGFVSMFQNKSLTDGTGALEALFKGQSWELPGIVRSLIGTGHTLYGAQGYRHSDVGYINDIWLCGILGCFLIYGMLVRYSYRLYKKSHVMVIRFAGLYIPIAFFVFNIKGAALGYNPGAAAMFTVLFGFTFYINEGEHENKTKID